MIKLEKLDKYYNKGKSNQIHVINEANLLLPEKGFISLLGPSGSGKTTLLNVIGGLDKAKGKIFYEDEEISSRQMDKFRRANIGYVFQNYHLLPNLSVIENLRLSLEEIGVHDLNEIDERIHYVLTALKLEKYKHRNVQALSGGQQQRVSIARALIKDARIIIADEPTGNLDSENSIEVMNILKKISQTRLVLLVTHNAVLAEFYSDRVIRLKDGSIISDTENHDDVKTLDTRNNSVIYLGDLEKETIGNNKVLIDIYEDNVTESQPIHLKIIKQNGAFYIDIPSHVKVMDKTNLKLAEEKYQDLTSESFDEYEFEMKPIPDSARKRSFSLKKLWRQIMQVFHNFYNVKFKTKLLYFGFVCIGAIMAISMIFLGSFNYVDMNQERYIEDYYTIEIDSKTYRQKAERVKDFYIKAHKLGYIENMVVQESSIKTVNFSEYFRKASLIISENNIKGKYLYGRAIENVNEIVISKLQADEIIKANKTVDKIGYKDILNSPMIIFYDENGGVFAENNEHVKCVGIVSDDSRACYISESQMYKFTRVNLITSWILNVGKIFHEKLIDDGIISVGSGERPSKDNDYLEVLLPFGMIPDLGESLKEIGDTIEINKKDYVVSGFYYSSTVDDYLLEIDENNMDSHTTGTIGIATEDLYLVEGRLPLNGNEIVVPYGVNMSLLEKKLDYEIVGRFLEPHTSTLKNPIKNFIYMHKSNYIETLLDLNPISYDFAGYFKYFIEVKNVNETKKLAEDYGLSLVSSYDAIYHSLHVEEKVPKLVLLTVSLTLIFIIIIYTFFIMRSKMISRIQEIGILRSIGASKSRIVRMFLVESLTIATFTSILGYLTITFGFIILNASLSQYIDFFKLSSLYLVSGVLVLYLINIIFGILPVTLLLRKKPAEILAKYDI